MSILLLALALAEPSGSAAAALPTSRVACTVSVGAVDDRGREMPGRRVSAGRVPAMVFRGRAAAGARATAPLLFDVFNPRGQRYQVLLATPTPRAGATTSRGPVAGPTLPGFRGAPRGGRLLDRPRRRCTGCGGSSRAWRARTGPAVSRCTSRSDPEAGRRRRRRGRSRAGPAQTPPGGPLMPLSAVGRSARPRRVARRRGDVAPGRARPHPERVRRGLPGRGGAPLGREDRGSPARGRPRERAPPRDARPAPLRLRRLAARRRARRRCSSTATTTSSRPAARRSGSRRPSSRPSATAASTAGGRWTTRAPSSPTSPPRAPGSRPRAGCP